MIPDLILAGPAGDSTEDGLRLRIAKLERINAALMTHVERVTDQCGGAYSLFQTAIMLDGRVRSRTEELTGLMHRLERSNQALEAAKNEAEQANRSKTRFLAAASHDLLQPLDAARLSVSTLGDLSLDPAAATVVRRVERGLQTIEELIKTLLDISKLDAGVLQPHRGTVRLRDLLAEVEAGFRPQAEAKGLRLTLRCAAGLAVESDAGLLKRIVGNIVSNAVRYTERGGVLIAARRRGGRCRIDVVDTGRGIPAGERDLVFEEFFRGSETDDVENGLGLGLAIVRRMAAALGHEISFTSRVARGSWFALAVPLCRQPPAPPADAETAPFARLRTLLVEQDPPTAMRQLLEGWGMAVVAVTDPGLVPDDPAEAARFDLLVVDDRVGGEVGGSDIVASVRARAGRPCPAVSRPPAPGSRVLAQAADCSSMPKPIRPAQLRSLLFHLLKADHGPSSPRDCPSLP